MRLQRFDTGDKGKKGIEIAKRLFPNFLPEPEGSWLDIAGIDGYLDGEPVQVKYDSEIAKSGNIYHEVYEKTAHRPDQCWRPAFGKVRSYIFTTETDSIEIGIKVSVDVLAETERGAKLVSICPNNGANTSLGFLVPRVRLNGKSEVRQRFKDKKI